MVTERFVCAICGQCAGRSGCDCWDEGSCTQCGSKLRKRQIKDAGEWIDEPTETRAQEGDDPATWPGDM